MVAELDLLSEWIPEQMLPGTVFVLENAGRIGKRTILIGQSCPVRIAVRWA